MTLTYYSGDAPNLSPVELALYGKCDPVRQMVRSAIRRYVAAHREILTGRLLDYGCGKPGTCAVPQPYRPILTCSEYVGWEPGDELALSNTFDSLICTQVIQLVEDPVEDFDYFFSVLRPGGHAVITYPVAWEEIETELWRFTTKGAWKLAHDAGFDVVDQSTLCRVVLDGALSLSLVNGMVLRKS